MKAAAIEYRNLLDAEINCHRLRIAWQAELEAVQRNLTRLDRESAERAPRLAELEGRFAAKGRRAA